MAKIVVNFENEQQAKQFINRVNQENLGEIRARVLSSDEYAQEGGGSASAPMITPAMGKVEVRSTETPVVPDQEQAAGEHNVSANVPVTESAGVQVMIEVDDAHEETVRHLLKNQH